MYVKWINLKPVDLQSIRSQCVSQQHKGKSKSCIIIFYLSFPVCADPPLTSYTWSHCYHFIQFHIFYLILYSCTNRHLMNFKFTGNTEGKIISLVIIISLICVPEIYLQSIPWIHSLLFISTVTTQRIIASPMENYGSWVHKLSINTEHTLLMMFYITYINM